MSTPKRKAINKMVSLYDPHLNMADHLMDDKGMTSLSDVIRQSIVFMHDKLYPNYIFTLTPAAKLKEREMKKIEKDEFISEEEFAIKKGLDIFTSEDGTGYALYRNIGHQPHLVPLEGIKEWAAEHEYEIDHTWQDKKIEPNESFFKRSSFITLLEEHNIPLPVAEEEV